ncbi:NADH-quinone oxidoreductase subunit B family protein [Desulfotalea psychrophila]|uniref:Related to methyl viologen-reducing hydrogenase, gamma chain n=1 Tax=Desulfotalea psychrophila (strain LSv54 / DSM 12343) TaxID=177439 RepID=Q6API3_DESPS|nr:methyl viologen-reducing hydrogenase [Desulfotalea psychrophila]CAG35741.1 related to methyl viologen-reducing hydrogenase, gamma chain [Desulfotalea psychrophila LSv54]
MGVKTAMEWLSSCSGCEIAILNIGEDLIPIITEALDIVHAPVLMDHKYFGQTGEGLTLEIPEATIGIVSGGVANEEHIEVLEEMRKKCTILIALGTCATHGGIPALMNGQDRAQSWKEIYQTKTTDPGGEVPNVEVPAPLDRVYACDEKVKIDLQLPGCPPNPAHIAEVIFSLLEDRPPVLPGKSVCDTCPTKREGKGDVSKLRRFLTNAEFEPGEPIDEMRCLLEQGYLCMGPVTAAGCARNGAPSCIAARVPCRGCFGPVRGAGNQMLDMMNALASNGIDCSSVIDRRSMLRFSGAHGMLRPVKKMVVKED